MIARRPFSETFHDLVSCTFEPVFNRLNENTRTATHNALTTIIGVIIAWLGFQLLLFAGVFTLAQALDGDYVASAMILGSIMVAPGLLIIITSFYRTSKPKQRT